MIKAYGIKQCMKDGDNYKEVEVLIVQQGNYVEQDNIEPHECGYQEYSYQQQYSVQQENSDQQQYSVQQENSDQQEDTDRLGSINPNCKKVVLIIVQYVIAFFFLCSGLVYINKCPADVRIPIGVSAIGVLLLCCRLLNSRYECRSACYSDDSWTMPRLVVYLNWALQIAVICSIMALFLWISHLHPETHPKSPDSSNYCDDSFYSTVQWVSTICVILFGLACLSFCFSLCKCEGQ